MKFGSIKLAAAVAAIAFIFVNVAPASAEDAYVTAFAGDGYSVASVEEYGGFEQISIRQATANVVSSGIGESWLCVNGVDQGDCASGQAGVDINARQLLPNCDSAAQENCIAGLELIKPDGTSSLAVFSETVRTSEITPAMPEQGLWEAKGISLYNDTSSGTPVSYAVSVLMQMKYDPNQNRWFTYGMDAGLYPYRTEVGSYEATVPKNYLSAQGRRGIMIRNDSRCSWNDKTRCGIAQTLSPDTRIKLSLRVTSELTGWFRGRITKQNVSVGKFSATNNLVTIEGNPVNVPRMRAVLTPENSTPEQQEAIKSHGGGGGNTVFQNEIKYPFSNWGEFSWVEMFRGIARDTSAGQSTLWNVSTIQGGGSGSKCLSETGRVLGMVSTNATLYNGIVPEFKDGMLTYKVAGMHYAPDGKTLNEGTYDLLMQSDVARCLYGFSKAPISATVSVIGEGGEEKTAVTVVNEKDGWLHLAAYGFSFSAPTINIKLSQAADPSPTPSSQPQASGKKITITCVKGKLTKKVTAVSPKCPAGYKKKA